MKALAELRTLAADDDDHRASGFPQLQVMRGFDNGIEDVGSAALAREQPSDTRLELRWIAREIDHPRRTVTELVQRDVGAPAHLPEEPAQRLAQVVDVWVHRLAGVGKDDDAERLRGRPILCQRRGCAACRGHGGCERD